MKTPKQLRTIVSEWASDDGDEQIIAKGLDFYAQGCSDEELVSVLRGTIKGLRLALAEIEQELFGEGSTARDY